MGHPVIDIDCRHLGFEPDVSATTTGLQQTPHHVLHGKLDPRHARQCFQFLEDTVKRIDGIGVVQVNAVMLQADMGAAEILIRSAAGIFDQRPEKVKQQALGHSRPGTGNSRQNSSTS